MSKARVDYITSEVLGEGGPGNTRTTWIAADVLIKPPIVGATGLWAVVKSPIFNNFGLNAVIREVLPPTQGQHDRAVAHRATQDDTVITVGEEILHDVLLDMFGRVEGLADPAPNRTRFGLNAFIQPYTFLDAVLLKEMGGSFGLDATFNMGGSFGLDAVFLIGPYSGEFSLNAWLEYLPANVIMAPLGGGTASYTASSNWSSTLPSRAADGITIPSGTIGSANGWGAASYVPGNTWWQVSWTVPQRLNRVILWDYAVGGYFGSSGRLVFSDGSEVPWTGLPSQFVDTHNRFEGNLLIDFASREVNWMRVVSDVGGGDIAGLHEVRAYDTEQYG